MFTTYDIATAVSSCNKNEQIRLQALLLVKNGLSPAKERFKYNIKSFCCQKRSFEEMKLYRLSQNSTHFYNWIIGIADFKYRLEIILKFRCIFTLK